MPLPNSVVSVTVIMTMEITDHLMEDVQIFVLETATRFVVEAGIIL